MLTGPCRFWVVPCRRAIGLAKGPRAAWPSILLKPSHRATRAPALCALRATRSGSSAALAQRSPHVARTTRSRDRHHLRLSCNVAETSLGISMPCIVLYKLHKRSIQFTVDPLLFLHICRGRRWTTRPCVGPPCGQAVGWAGARACRSSSSSKPAPVAETVLSCRSTL
jgi:hypothetical protein